MTKLLASSALCSIKEITAKRNPSSIIQKEKFLHLHQLAGLGLPKDTTEEESLLKSIQSMENFVSYIHNVPTDQTPPLRNIVHDFLPTLVNKNQ